jgi:PPOX class probable F420-dependent enzyme
MRTEQWVIKLLYESRAGHMATSTKHGTPHAVPICYAFNGKTIYSSIDEKPKRVGWGKLRRVRNITENPRICLVVDAYSENWRSLRYAIVSGLAKILNRGEEHRQAVRLLKRKYPQYRKMQIKSRPIIRIMPVRTTGWRFDLEV